MGCRNPCTVGPRSSFAGSTVRSEECTEREQRADDHQEPRDIQDEAVRIDWGIILLFGGGLAMGELAFSTGLAEAMGRGITSWLPVQSETALTILFTAVAIIMSEAASNTASANMIVPIAIAVAQAAGVNPLQPALGATLGASMGFMMPISTPPNAIVYSSGHVPITAMMRHGIALDIVGFVVIVAMVIGFGWAL